MVFWKKAVLATAAVLTLAPALFLSHKGTEKIYDTQPEWYFLTPHSYKKFLHIMGVGLGFRTLIGDIEYITFLQYYGDRDNRATKYEKLYEYLDNVTDADPHFSFAYQYGAAIFAFNLRQFDNAEKLIRKGLRYNPEFWRLRLYLGAITYKELEDKEKYVKYLEEAVKFKDHPAMIDRILGNIYEQYKPADEAASYWLKVYTRTNDRQTKDHAKNRLVKIISEGKLENPEAILKRLEE